MLFDVTCRTGRLQVDEATVRVVSFGKTLWSTPRDSLTYIGVTKGAVMADINVYTIDYHYPARLVTKQEAERFLTLFPGVPNGPQLVPRPAAFAASPVPGGRGQRPVRRSTGPGSKKKRPLWVYIVTGILALLVCGCLGSALVSGVMGNASQTSSNQQATPTLRRWRAASLRPHQRPRQLQLRPDHQRLCQPQHRPPDQHRNRRRDRHNRQHRNRRQHHHARRSTAIPGATISPLARSSTILQATFAAISPAFPVFGSQMILATGMSSSVRMAHIASRAVNEGLAPIMVAN